MDNSSFAIIVGKAKRCTIFSSKNYFGVEGNTASEFLTYNKVLVIIYFQNTYFIKKNFKLKEHQIIFVNRKLGNSKMNQNIILEAIFGVIKLKIKSFFK